MDSPVAKVLLVDDESDILDPMTRLLEKNGFQVTACRSGEHALSEAERQKFDFALIDLLLPSLSGVDLAKSIRKTSASGASQIFLMSGIFTDQSSIQENTQATGALDFFTKPFDSKKVIKIFNDLRGAIDTEGSQAPQKSLHKLLHMPEASPRKKRKIIESLEHIHSFDLPVICSLLVETESSGHLNIVSAEGKLAGINFAGGHIVGVDLADQETFLGQLLLDAKFISLADLDLALGSPNQRRIGERLVRENFLSPHAVDWALRRQMEIRLNSILGFGEIQINYAPATVDLLEPYISPTDYSQLMFHLITTRVDSSWLISLYKLQMSANLTVGEKFSDLSSVSEGKDSSEIQKIVELAKAGKMTLASILKSEDYDSSLFLQTLHYLIVRRIVRFEERNVEGSQQGHFIVLESLSREIARLNYFEIFQRLGSTSKPKPAEVKQVYEDFKNWVRELDGATEKAKIPDLKETIQFVNKAFETLRDPQLAEKYEQDLAAFAVKSRIKASEKFMRGVDLLNSGQFQKALSEFKRVKELKANYDQLDMYILWAELSAFPSFKPADIAKLEKKIARINDQDKMTAIFSHVEGLLSKHKGNIMNARMHFSKAVQRDATFVMAKRELANLTVKKSDNDNKDFLHKDITQIFSSIFKKKKS